MASRFTAINGPELGATRNEFRISIVHPTDLKFKVRCPDQHTAASGPPKAHCTGEISVAFAIDCIATNLAINAQQWHREVIHDRSCSNLNDVHCMYYSLF